MYQLIHSPFSSHQLCDCCLECSWLGHDSASMPICAMGQVNIKSSFCRVSISILQKRHRKNLYQNFDAVFKQSKETNMGEIVMIRLQLM